MAVEWTERLSVGFEPIDAQHRELIRRFDGLLAACETGRGQERIAELLDYLGDYVDSHFAMEEGLMQHHDYPEAAQHREEHRFFHRKLAALRNSLEQQGPSPNLVIQTNQALLAWFIKHVRNIDVKFGIFLRARLPGTGQNSGATGPTS